MSTLATMIVVIAVCGAIVSWAVAVLFSLRTLHGLSGPERRRLRWLAILAWPFAVTRMTGAPAEHASKVNKALVAFFACLMVALAATSVMTNLSRLSR
jgi:hypothetical protein